MHLEWEYDLIDLGVARGRQREIDILNEAGARGWELIAVLPPQRALMRRPVSRGSASEAVSSAPAAAAPTTLPPKYRDPATGETWSGRGRMANWLAERLRSGDPIEKYEIK